MKKLDPPIDKEKYKKIPNGLTEYERSKVKYTPTHFTFTRIKEGKYEVAGAVLHKVIPEVDEGKIIAEEKFNAFNLSLDDLFRILKDRSLYMWCNFLRQVL